MVVNQTFTSITVSPASPSFNENATQQFTATAFDQFGQSIANPTFAWSTDPSGVGSITSGGNFSSGIRGGTGIVLATAGGVTGTATVNVNNATPTLVIPANADNLIVAATGTVLHVLANDDGGESNLTYSWTVVDAPNHASPTFSINGTNASKDTLVSFDEAGAYTFVVSISDGSNTITSNVSITVDQTLTMLKVDPAPQTPGPGQPVRFTASGFDQFGHRFGQTPSVTWSTNENNTIDSTGLFTDLSSAATAIITATAGNVSGSAVVNLNQPIPTPPVIPPTPPVTPPAPPPPPPAPPTPPTPPTPTPTPPTVIPPTGVVTVPPTTPTPTPTPPVEKPVPTPGPTPVPNPGPGTPAESVTPTTPVLPNHTLSTPTGGTIGNSVHTNGVQPFSMIGSRIPMSLAEIAKQTVADTPAGSRLTLEQLVPQDPTAVVESQSPAAVEQAAQQLQETARNIAAKQQVLHRVLNTFATFSATASAGYLLWIARGGSLLLSLLSSAPIWRFLDPLPVLNAPKGASRKRKWYKRQNAAPVPESGDDKVERFMD